MIQAPLRPAFITADHPGTTLATLSRPFFNGDAVHVDYFAVLIVVKLS
jgi:hypothetical protein